ncbi:MAG: Tfp pilus assembly protein FimT [Psychroserpens sp.]|jgi:Tfp pilus assembly protein FimT
MLTTKANALKVSSYRGLTLIELLVVISIMMTLIALVGPLAMNTIDKAEAQSEYLSFSATLRRASVKAFVNGTGVHIELNNHQLKAFSIKPSFTSKIGKNKLNKQLIVQQNYEYLVFSDSIIEMNKNGIANVSEIELKQGNKNRTINLIALLEN